VPRLKEAAELVARLGGQFTIDNPLPEVIAKAHQAGGICVIAHPGRPDLGPVLTAETLDAMLAEFPLDGLETHYRTYTDADTTRYRELAESRGLLTSTGSDSHGPGQPVDPRPYEAIWAKDLLARLGVEVAPRADGAPAWGGIDPRNAPVKPTS